jgi:hypothetical protein
VETYECLHYVKRARYNHVNISNKIAKYVIWTIFEDVFEARAIISGKGIVRITQSQPKKF